MVCASGRRTRGASARPATVARAMMWRCQRGGAGRSLSATQTAAFVGRRALQRIRWARGGTDSVGLPVAGGGATNAGCTHAGVTRVADGAPGRYNQRECRFTGLTTERDRTDGRAGEGRAGLRPRLLARDHRPGSAYAALLPPIVPAGQDGRSARNAVDHRSRSRGSSPRCCSLPYTRCCRGTPLGPIGASNETD